MNKSCVLILVVAYVTLVGAADRQGINCKDEDGGAPCARDYDPEDAAELAEKWLYTIIAIVVGILVAIGVLIASCLFCSFCPAYRHRQKKGVVYGTTTTQQQQQPVPAYPQQSNLQPPLQSSYPGGFYSPGQIQPQIQPANEPYYNTVPEYKQYSETGHTTGASEVQPPYNPNPPPY
ncbi:uncharacterized protein LOC110835773 isoform X2 [Zootermopsis nevadensis]|uniref:uncharacterized protein LOC110835773 isoform X2 n=1 Tax=Zootermopsis nevadensis TaxID=136037 RepID=UPI000B8EA3D1|nr:uncharacterized protein LOC110835773 isoform X2 [Zootermopsis nevadensis]